MSSTEQFDSLRWAWALREADISPRLESLALTMFTYADRQGRMFPTVETLRLKHVNDDGKPVVARTIIRWRNDLVRLGWLALVKKGDGRGPRNASV
jgi:hypothetical protein